MSSSLHKFETWLLASRADFERQLNIGASPDAIASLQAQFDVPIPTDFRDYLAWHDGQPFDSSTLYGNKQLMPVAEIVDAIRIFNDCRDAGEFATDDWWKKSWIPFVADGGGNHFVLDLVSGGIYEFWKSDVDRPIIANSFSEWLDHLVNMFLAEDWVLERGAYIPASESTPADSYERVSVVLLRPPEGGLSALKHIYDKLSLSYGIGKLYSDSNRGPVALFTNIYYMDACRLLSRLEDPSPFEIRSDEDVGQAYPLSEP